jgi:hypothetical protein
MELGRNLAAVIGIALALWECAPKAAETAPTPAEGPAVTLQVPRGTGQHEGLQVLVTMGPTPPRTRLLVRLSSGALAGVIVPYGAVARGRGATYAVPVTPSAIQRGTVTLHLALEEDDGSTRSPTSGEVTQLTLVRTP